MKNKKKQKEEKLINACWLFYKDWIAEGKPLKLKQYENKR